MGVDMSDYAELIAHEKTVDEMADYFEADSLYFISEDGMVDAIGAEKSYCNACFNGRYPFELNTNLTKFCFEAGAVL